MVVWLADFLSGQNLLPTAHIISQMLPGHLQLLISLLLTILYSPCCSPCCGNEHIKAIWSHSVWAPVSFLSSSFPGTLILIACFFAVASPTSRDQNLFLVFVPDGALVWRRGKACREDDVSDVILGHAVQACDATPLPIQSSQIFFLTFVLLEEEGQSHANTLAKPREISPY